MGWRDTIQDDEAASPTPQASTAPPGGSWRDTIRTEETDPTQSPVTALTTGIARGAVPFASALAGAGRAGMNAVTGVTGPLAGGDLGDVVDDYRNARDSFQSDATKAADAHPKTALVGMMAGGVANPLFKDAKTLPDVMVAGGAQGLGDSSADLTKGEFDKAGQDAALGTLGGAGGYAVGKAIPAIAEGTRWAGRKALTNLGPTAEAISARLKGGAQDSAKSYGSLAEELATTLKDLGKRTKEMSDEAGQHLSADRTIPRVTVTTPFDEAIGKLKIQGKTVGDTDKAAEATLKGFADDFGKLKKNLSEKDIKTILGKLDDNINWDDQTRDVSNTALEKVRTVLDQALKFRNKNYKSAMEPVAEQTRLLGDLKSQFNLRGVPGKGLRPTDTTATKIMTSLRENKDVTEANLKLLSKLTGKDFMAMANDYKLSGQFDVKAPNASSKKTNLGIALGAGVGGLVGHATGQTAGGMALGTMVGASAGGAMDAYGGQVAGKIIDTYLKAGQSKVFGKFAPVIQKAADQGPQALAVATSMLAKNPEFKAMLDDIRRHIGVP